MKLLENSRENLGKSERKHYLAGILPYNAANYEIQQAFIHEGEYLTYNEMQRRIQSHEACKALSAKDVLRSIVPKNLVLYCTGFMELPAGFCGSSSSPGDHTVGCGSSLTLCGSGLRVAERSR